MLAVAGVIPASSARANDDAMGIVAAPSPVAGAANATLTAMTNAHCNVADPAVTSVQGSDGYAVDMGRPVTSIALQLVNAAAAAIPPDLDVYFLSEQCTFAGSLATPSPTEQGQPQACTLDPLTGQRNCVPTTPRYAVVTLTSGVNVAFALSWQ